MGNQMEQVVLLFLLIFFFQFTNASVEVAYGYKAVISEFPHIVSIVDKDQGYHFCGGGLINSQTILTAGHCVYDHEKDEVMSTSGIGIIIGNDELSSVESYSVRNIESIVVHPGYNYTEINHDIALIILDETILEGDSGVRYMTVPTVPPEEGVGYWVAGWGATEKDDYSSQLKKAYMPIQPLSKCTYPEMEMYPVQATQICAGDGHKDSCLGDSGGPLVHISHGAEKRWIAGGIVSYGPTPCGHDGNFGVYTNVSNYHSWIWANAAGYLPANSTLGTLSHLTDKISNNRSCFGVSHRDHDLACNGRGYCYLQDQCDCAARVFGIFAGAQCTQLSRRSLVVLFFGGFIALTVFCGCIAIFALLVCVKTCRMCCVWGEDAKFNRRMRQDESVYPQPAHVQTSLHQPYTPPQPVYNGHHGNGNGGHRNRNMRNGFWV